MALSPRWRRAGLNVLLAAVLLFPLWYLTMWLLATREGPQPSDAWLGAADFYLLLLVPQFVVGAVVQQGLLLVLPLISWPRWLRRLVAIASTATIPFVLVAFGGDPGLQLTLIPALLLYGSVIVIPQGASQAESQAPQLRVR